ncbi:MAG: dephospho-CoA kinase [Actinomycetaceae bacterium]|nr:dephospho-CoA kinase [Actinomycetaceae bacterium]
MSESPVRILRPFHSAGPSRSLRVGVTGGIGAGKTTVTSVLASLGARVISADDLVRQLQQPGGAAVDAIVERFGPTVRGVDGGIERKALARLVFSDAQARRDLENIVHPLVARQAQQFLSTARGGEVAVYDVPLLVETGVHDYCDAVVVVWADVASRLSRLASQRGMTREEAMARIRAQATDAERERIAHAIVDNTVAQDEVHRAVADELWPALVAAATKSR